MNKPFSTEEEIQSCVEDYLRAKGLPQHIALAFADVVLIDRTSRINKRSDIRNLSTLLVKDFPINIPIVSANMKDVTESEIAIALAREGGCGFLHQFDSIERRVEEVKKVKRADNEVIEHPFTTDSGSKLSEAINFMKSHRITGLVVTNKEGILEGIITTRDTLFLELLGQNPEQMTVKEVMTKSPLITACQGVKIEEAAGLLQKHKIEKLPLVDDGNHVVGLITAKDILKKIRYPRAARDKKGQLIVGATVGVNDNALRDTEKLIDAGADIILLDTARANAFIASILAKKLKEHFVNVPLIAGNVDNPEGTLLLIRAGADAIKVGIGPGSACKTRMETGVGVPQLTAIAECSAVARKFGVPIIADGGIHNGRDMVLSLVAGASSVMLGSAFAGTDESPGEVLIDNGQSFKIYRGSASIDAQLDRIERGNLDKMRAPEGEPRRVPYKGDVISVIEDWLSDLRSAMSYANACSIEELQSCKLRWQSPAGYQEGGPQI